MRTNERERQRKREGKGRRDRDRAREFKKKKKREEERISEKKHKKDSTQFVAETTHTQAHTYTQCTHTKHRTLNTTVPIQPNFTHFYDQRL